MSVYFAEGGIKNNFALLDRLRACKRGRNRRVGRMKAQLATAGKFHSALSQKIFIDAAASLKIFGSFRMKFG
jgi:hypothetical protein